MSSTAGSCVTQLMSCSEAVLFPHHRMELCCCTLGYQHGVPLAQANGFPERARNNERSVRQTNKSKLSLLKTYCLFLAILCHLFLLQLLGFCSGIQVLVIFKSCIYLLVFLSDALLLKLFFSQLMHRSDFFITLLLGFRALGIFLTGSSCRILWTFSHLLELLSLLLDFFVAPIVVDVHDLVVGRRSVCVRHVNRTCCLR